MVWRAFWQGKWRSGKASEASPIAGLSHKKHVLSEARVGAFNRHDGAPDGDAPRLWSGSEWSDSRESFERVGESPKGSASVGMTPTPSNSDTGISNTTSRAHILVVGNQKGGSGKSTTTMHLISALLDTGATVASLDLDARQGTLSRYVQNRQAYCSARNVDLPMPIHRAIEPSSVASVDVARAHDARAVEHAVDDLSSRVNYIVIDTPGTDNFLSRVGHSYADTLVTPLNDSFLDLDVLASIDPDTLEMVKPSQYADMVFQVKMQKARRDKVNRTFDWVVMRNRLSHLGSRNQWEMNDAVEKLGKRIGFRPVAGFSERVIFRELFLKGLTLLDLPKVRDDVKMTMSHVAARQEVRDLVRAIGLEQTAGNAETVNDQTNASPLEETASQ